MLSIWVTPQNSAPGPRSESDLFWATPLAIPSAVPNFLAFWFIALSRWSVRSFVATTIVATRKLWERSEFPLHPACASHLKHNIRNPLKVSCDFP